MPAFCLRPPLFGCAAAALLASVLAAPARAQVAFGYGYPVAWSCCVALPYYLGHAFAIALPGYARAAGWPAAGLPLAGGVHGAAGRLYLR